MKMHKLLHLTTFIITVCFANTLVFADTITLENGDRLSGSITSMQDGVLKFTAQYGGDLEIPWEAIVSITSDQPIRTQLLNDNIINGALATGPDQKIQIEDDGVTGEIAFETSNVKAINPPTPEELAAIDLAGFINVGISATSGNSDTQTYNLAAEFTANAGPSRYTLGGAFNRGEDDGETIVDNWNIYGAYDYFINDQWFWNNSLTLQQNDLQELDLRTAVGTGVGYQAFNTDELKLAGTFGLAYLREDFAIQPSEESIAARWSIDYEHLWRPWLTFFHYNEGLVSVEDVNDFVITSRTGWRFPIVERLTGSVQVNFNYDNSPSIGTEREDFIYLFNLGYAWD